MTAAANPRIKLFSISTIATGTAAAAAPGFAGTQAADFLAALIVISKCYLELNFFISRIATVAAISRNASN